MRGPFLIRSGNGIADLRCPVPVGDYRAGDPGRSEDPGERAVEGDLGRDRLVRPAPPAGEDREREAERSRERQDRVEHVPEARALERDQRPCPGKVRPGRYTDPVFLPGQSDMPELLRKPEEEPFCPVAGDGADKVDPLQLQFVDDLVLIHGAWSIPSVVP